MFHENQALAQTELENFRQYLNDTNAGQELVDYVSGLSASSKSWHPEDLLANITMNEVLKKKFVDEYFDAGIFPKFWKVFPETNDELAEMFERYNATEWQAALVFGSSLELDLETELTAFIAYLATDADGNSDIVARANGLINHLVNDTIIASNEELNTQFQLKYTEFFTQREQELAAEKLPPTYYTPDFNPIEAKTEAQILSLNESVDAMDWMLAVNHRVWFDRTPAIFEELQAFTIFLTDLFPIDNQLLTRDALRSLFLYFDDTASAEAALTDVTDQTKLLFFRFQQFKYQQLHPPLSFNPRPSTLEDMEALRVRSGTEWAAEMFYHLAKDNNTEVLTYEMAQFKDYLGAEPEVNENLRRRVDDYLDRNKRNLDFIFDTEKNDQLFFKYLQFFAARAADTPESVDPSFVNPMISTLEPASAYEELFNPFPFNREELWTLKNTYSATQWILQIHYWGFVKGGDRSEFKDFLDSLQNYTSNWYILSFVDRIWKRSSTAGLSRNPEFNQKLFDLYEQYFLAEVAIQGQPSLPDLELPKGSTPDPSSLPYELQFNPMPYQLSEFETMKSTRTGTEWLLQIHYWIHQVPVPFYQRQSSSIKFTKFILWWITNVGIDDEYTMLENVLYNSALDDNLSNTTRNDYIFEHFCNFQADAIAKNDSIDYRYRFNPTPNTTQEYLELYSTYSGTEWAIQFHYFVNEVLRYGFYSPYPTYYHHFDRFLIEMGGSYLEYWAYSILTFDYAFILDEPDMNDSLFGLLGEYLQLRQLQENISFDAYADTKSKIDALQSANATLWMTELYNDHFSEREDFEVFQAYLREQNASSQILEVYAKLKNTEDYYAILEFGKTQEANDQLLQLYISFKREKYLQDLAFPESLDELSYILDNFSGIQWYQNVRKNFRNNPRYDVISTYYTEILEGFMTKYLYYHHQSNDKQYLKINEMFGPYLYNDDSEVPFEDLHFYADELLREYADFYMARKELEEEDWKTEGFTVRLRQQQSPTVLDQASLYYELQDPLALSKLEQFNEEVEAIHSPLLWVHWNYVAYNTSKEEFYFAEQHLVVDFNWYLLQHGYQEEITCFESFFGVEPHQPEPYFFYFHSNCSEMLKEKYVEFVNQMIKNHPFNGHLNRFEVGRQVNRLNLTVEEAEAMPGTEFLLILNTFYKSTSLSSSWSSFNHSCTLMECQNLIWLLNNFKEYTTQQNNPEHYSFLTSALDSEFLVTAASYQAENELIKGEFVKMMRHPNFASFDFIGERYMMHTQEQSEPITDNKFIYTEFDYFTTLLIEGPDNDIFDITNTFYQGFAPNASDILNDCLSKIREVNGLELANYWFNNPSRSWDYGIETAIDEIHIFRDFGWYLAWKGRHDIFNEVQFNPQAVILKQDAAVAEELKALYIEFVTVMVNDHPFKDSPPEPSTIVQVNLTVSEVRQMTGKDLWSLWDFTYRNGPWYDKQYIALEYQAFNNFTLSIGAPTWLPDYPTERQIATFIDTYVSFLEATGDRGIFFMHRGYVSQADKWQFYFDTFNAKREAHVAQQDESPSNLSITEFEAIMANLTGEGLQKYWREAIGLRNHTAEAFYEAYTDVQRFLRHLEERQKLFFFDFHSFVTELAKGKELPSLSDFDLEPLLIEYNQFAREIMTHDHRPPLSFDGYLRDLERRIQEEQARLEQLEYPREAMLYQYDWEIVDHLIAKYDPETVQELNRLIGKNSKYFPEESLFSSYDPLPHIDYGQREMQCHPDSIRDNSCTFTLKEVEFVREIQSEPIRIPLNISELFQPENNYVFMGNDHQAYDEEGSPIIDPEQQQNTVFCLGKAYKGCLKYDYYFFEILQDIYGYFNCTDQDTLQRGNDRVNYNELLDTEFTKGSLNASILTNYKFYTVLEGEEAPMSPEGKQKFIDQLGQHGELADLFEEDESGLFLTFTGRDSQYASVRLYYSEALLEFNRLNETMVNGKPYINNECYCKNVFLQCPVVQFRLLNADSRIQLNTDRGQEVPELVINGSEPFEMTVQFEVQFMNVEQAQAVDMKVWIQNYNGQSQDQMDPLQRVMTTLQQCYGFQQQLEIGQSHDITLYVGATDAEAEIDLQSQVTSLIQGCDRVKWKGFQVTSITQPGQFSSFRSISGCSTSDCMKLKVDTSKRSRGTFSLIVNFEDDLDPSSTVVLVLADYSLEVALGINQGVQPSEVPSTISIKKYSSASSDPSNIINVPPFPANGVGVTYYAISSSDRDISPASTLLSFDQAKMRVQVDSSVNTREPIKFYVFGSTTSNKVAGIPAYYAFSQAIEVSIECDSSTLEPFSKERLYVQAIGEEVKEITEEEYTGFFNNSNQFCRTMTYSLSADEQGTPLTKSFGQEVFWLNSSTKAIQSSRTITLPATYKFYIQAVREDGKVAYQAINYRFISNSTSVVVANQEDTPKEEVVVDFLDGIPQTDEKVTVLTFSPEAAISSVKPIIPSLIQPALKLHQSSTGEFLLVFNPQKASIEMQGTFDVTLQISATSSPLAINYNLQIIIKVNNIITQTVVANPKASKTGGDLATGIEGPRDEEILVGLSRSVRSIIRPQRAPAIDFVTAQVAEKSIAAFLEVYSTLRILESASSRPELTIITEADRSSTITLKPSSSVVRPWFLENDKESQSPQQFSPMQFDVPRDLLDVYLLLQSDIDPTQMNYSIVLQSWETNGLTFKLQFDDPLLISMGSEQDEIILKFKDSRVLVPQKSSQVDSLSNGALQVKLPRQFPNIVMAEEEEDQAETSKSLVLTLSVMAVGALMYMGKSLDCMINMFLCLQMMTIVPIFNLQVPANAQVFLLALQSVSRLDYLTPTCLFGLPDPSAFHQVGNLELGYQTTNLWVNLQIYYCWVLLVLGELMLRRTRRQTFNLHLLIRGMHKILYLQLIVATSLSLTTGSLLNSSFGCFVFIAHSKLVNKEQSFSSKELLRRIPGVILPAFILNARATKVMLLCVINFICLLRYNRFNKVRNPTERLMGKLNEFFQFSVIYFMASFTDFGDSSKARYHVGSVFISFVYLMLAINFGQIFWTISHQVKLRFQARARLQAILERASIDKQRKARWAEKQLSVLQRRQEQKELDRFDVNVFIGKDESTETINQSYKEQLSAILEQPEVLEDDGTERGPTSSKHTTEVTEKAQFVPGSFQIQDRSQEIKKIVFRSTISEASENQIKLDVRKSLNEEERVVDLTDSISIQKSQAKQSSNSLQHSYKTRATTFLGTSDNVIFERSEEGEREDSENESVSEVET